jgi:hypothetical protein
VAGRKSIIKTNPVKLASSMGLDIFNGNKNMIFASGFYLGW